MYEIYQNKALGARTMLDYYLKQITDVADEPLGLTDAVLHSYLDLGSPVDSAQSDYVGTVCTAARQSVETIINGPIGEQEWELGLTGFPCGYVIEIHKPPLIQVQSIKYTKNDGTEAVLYDATASPVVQSDIFTVETGSTPGAIFLKATESWPSDILANGFPVKIRFLAGVDPIPKDLLQMIRRVFGNLWENRELTMEDGGLDENAVRWLKTKYGYDELA